jgi:hypothetical protein
MARLYDTARWQRVRATQLEREPLCRVCAGLGSRVPATEVDHITPVSAGGARFDGSNLQSLCTPHHSLKTNLFDKKAVPWSPQALDGCHSDGTPCDPSHPWYEGQGGVQSAESVARRPCGDPAAELISCEVSRGTARAGR